MDDGSGRQTVIYQNSGIELSDLKWRHHYIEFNNNTPAKLQFLQPINNENKYLVAILQLKILNSSKNH